MSLTSVSREIRSVGLTGTISRAIGVLTKLLHLDLSNNSLHSSLPTELSKCTLLTFINIQVNKLTGPLFDGWAPLTALADFHASVNNFVGPIPQSVTALSGLQRVSLRNNSFSSIPAGLLQLPKLMQMCDVPRRFCSSGSPPARSELGHNQLRGSIPSPINQQTLSHINVENNFLTGELPTPFISFSNGAFEGVYSW